MTIRPILVAGYFGAIVIGTAYMHLNADPLQGAKPGPRAVIDKYCVTCHNGKLKTAGLLLDALDPDHAGDHADVWEKVARKLRTGEMPPPGAPRPDPATYADVTAQIEAALDAVAAAKPNPGRVAVHRLNRAEYTAAVRDLLGL